MSDIFISYKREDFEKVRPFAENLENKGWSVWWDPKLRGGQPFSKDIEKALSEARCVIVVWSSKSIDSYWVAAEATKGLNRDILVAVTIESNVEPHVPFNVIHTNPLINWSGTSPSTQFEKIVEDLKSILGPSPADIKEAEKKAEEERNRIQAEERNRKKEAAERRAEEERKQKEAEDKLRAEQERERKLTSEEQHLTASPTKDYIVEIAKADAKAEPQISVTEGQEKLASHQKDPVSPEPKVATKLQVLPHSAFSTIGTVFALSLTLVGLFAPILAPHDHIEQSLHDAFQPPFTLASYPLGTDRLGRDVLSRIMFCFQRYAFGSGIAFLLGTTIALLLARLNRKKILSKRERIPLSSVFELSILKTTILTGLIAYICVAFTAILGGMEGITSFSFMSVSMTSALIPLSAVYQSSMGALDSAETPERCTFTNLIRLSIIPIALKVFSLTILIVLLINIPLEILNLSSLPPIPSMGNMLSASIGFSAIAVFQLALLVGIIFVSIGALLAIVW